MIPLQLKLKNFLSYHEANLDFQGLHTACICGPNGAGKSSLLEAITWAIWGQSRTASDDDVINAGAKDVRVDFTFTCNQQTYKVIRGRSRGRSSTLEFQVKSEAKFRPLTGKGLRATQQVIIEHLRLDYDTFINSAYLRQGRADEFMLRRPSERKQILADLLKLDQYEKLAEQAKDTSKQLKGQSEQLQLSIEPLQQQLAERQNILAQKAKTARELQQLQQLQEQGRQQLQQLQAQQHRHQTAQENLLWQQNRYQTLRKDGDRLLRDQASLQGQLQELAVLLTREEEIKAGYAQFNHLQAEEERWAVKFQAYQDGQQKRQQLEVQLNRETQDLNLKISRNQTRLDALEQQEAELDSFLSQEEEVKKGLQELQQHRNRLRELDQLQLQVSPLLLRRSELQVELERVRAKLNARLEQLQNSRGELQNQVSQVPQMREQILTVDAEIRDLENKKVYQQRVNEKGQERRNFRERLQENQRQCEKIIAELQQKLTMLETPGAVCPLCEQSLDDHYRHRVVQKTQTEEQENQQQIWVLREQMTVCDRELQVLRREYAQIARELSPYERLLQERGQLEAQLETSGEYYVKLQEIAQETESIEQALGEGNYALELQTELANLNQELQELNYDEQTHALVRGEEKRWRRAEIKSAQLEDARKRRKKVTGQKPELVGAIKSAKETMSRLRQDSPLQQEINQVEKEMQELGYERSRHNEIIAAVREASRWQLQQQKLEQAQQQRPQLQERLGQLEVRIKENQGEQQQMQAQLAESQAQIAQTTDYSKDLQQLERQLQQRREDLDGLLSQQGRWEQRLTQLGVIEKQHEETQQNLTEVQKKYRVYRELAQAFGKKGIQALMIENILPQLEAQTNQILSRLTGNQLHVQFLTQREGRGSRSKRKTTKMIDTLDILIADARGTRPYETYSGGEGFRINFSIRLALARLLAQRAGTALQMLIVDEGFGTQDAEGCDRLIASINAIAADFSCILAVTHMPQFKEAFQTRIEVRKTNQGSQLFLTT